MSNELALKQTGEVVGVPTMVFTREQVELVKRTVAKDATDDELALFLYTCKRTGLDPLAKQIHFVKRNTKNGPQASFQTAIDGYRLAADRTGKYAGNDDPIFDDEKNPTKATVTVHKIVGGISCPFTATARWDQYYPGDAQGFMWKKMPHLMLGKCAEALALRKAFPAELSGIYTHEEMEQSYVPEAGQQKQAETPQTSGNGSSHLINDKQSKRAYAIWKTAGHADNDVKAWLKASYGIENTKEIKADDYEAICLRLEKKDKLGSLDENGK